METLVQDAKFAARQLLKEKSFFAASALTLALCIGANSTIFSVVNSILLRPLPFQESHRLVTMQNLYPGAGHSEGGSNGVPDYYDRRALTDVFEEVAVYRRRGRSVDIDGVPQRLTTREVTPSFFPLLRVAPALGRGFDESDGEVGANNVTILSHGLWRQIYNEDPGVVGETLRIDGNAFTIVGVLPEGFRFIDDEIRLWTPFAFTSEQKQQYHNNSWSMVARLSEDVSLESTQLRIDALNTANLDKFPEMKPLLLDAGFYTRVEYLQDALVKRVRGNLFLLWGGVAFVLLIGCVNVASLVLVRTSVRARELATRFAVGASQRRVMQQVVTETVILTLVGGSLGLVVGFGAMRALGHLGVSQMPRGAEVSLDSTTVVFTLGLALVVGLLVSLIPVLALVRVRLTSILRDQGRGGTAGRGMGALRKVLVSAQVALAMVLLVGGGLLVSSFQRVVSVDPGFDVAGILTGSAVLTANRYPEARDRRTFISNALEQIRALPGVERAGITSNLPFGGNYSDSVIFAEGYVMKPGESAVSPTRSTATPGYFEALGIRLLDGRDFDFGDDDDDSRRVMIVDRRLADRFWPDGDALGKRMWRPTGQDMMKPADADFIQIVGIVESVRMRELVSEQAQLGAYYFPMSQMGGRSLDFVIRTSGDPNALVASVRQVIGNLDPELPLFDIRSMTERIGDSLIGQRTPMLLTVIFALAALGLAAVGIYGMLAYIVQIRTREIGIRVALGSDVSGIFGLVLRDGLWVVGAGLVGGLVGAAGLRRFIESQLHEVSPFDPLVLASVIGLLGSVAALSCALPAWRATRIEPTRALAES